MERELLQFEEGPHCAFFNSRLQKNRHELSFALFSLYPPIPFRFFCHPPLEKRRDYVVHDVLRGGNDDLFRARGQCADQKCQQLSERARPSTRVATSYASGSIVFPFANTVSGSTAITHRQRIVTRNYTGTSDSEGRSVREWINHKT